MVCSRPLLVRCLLLMKLRSAAVTGRLEREVVQQRELLSELCREVLRLQVHCAGQEAREAKGEALAHQLEGTRIV